VNRHILIWTVLAASLLAAGCTPPRAPLSSSAKAVVRKFGADVLKVDMEKAEGRNVVWDQGARGYRFDGSNSYARVTNGVPKRIADRDFSIFLQARLDRQLNPTAYIFEHHLGFPWTGLFLAIENNNNLRFRLKDLPHCDIIHPIASLLGDGMYHSIVVSRHAQTLGLFIDGELVKREDKPELVNLDIDYGGKVLTLGSHCEMEPNCCFAGCLNNVHVFFGRCLTTEEVKALAQ
jgi:hypothetical protein